jgi:endonuclease/exonuclease/phosphatase family metal-dependent hydrolase
MRFLRLLAWAVLFIYCLPAQTLRVMSFNVRYPNANDGDSVWANRRDLFVDTIRRHDPDLFGTQELFHEQGQYIVEKLPAYAWFGLSRRGNHEDEHMGVFYRKDRLTLIDSGDFWLSETPEKPGSMSWGTDLPRMVTWGMFEIKATGTRFLHLNTHFPHRGRDEAARQRAARLIACRIGLYDENLPILLTGDFNAPASGPTYQILVPLMKDSYTEAAQRSGPAGSFHGFTGKAGPARIDWILFRAPWKVTEAAVLDDHAGPRYPSDHFPVLAVFDLR